MRFLLFVEGKTEKQGIPAFVKRWLDAHGLQHVGVTPVNFDGNASFVEDAPTKAETRLTDRRAGEIIAIIGLLDLYGLPDGYDHGDTVEERYEFAKRRIEREVAQPRYRQHFAVHETEAWLLSDLSILPRGVGNRFASLSRTPETVNFNHPPAKRLDDAYFSELNRGYRKAVDGRSLFGKLDPSAVLDKCPYFKWMIDDMVGLAKSAGA